ncbi:MAG: response regulator [Pseudomonadota bacterium]
MDKFIGDYRILVVDDVKDIHTIFNRILTYQPQIKAGQSTPILQTLPTFKIDDAFQGEDALNLVKQALADNKPYALAFVDIRMPPGWDGIKTIQQIWDVDKDIQIVICTGGSDYSWEETVVKLDNIENFLILKKPFDAVTVRQIACALTTKWRLTQQARLYTEKLEKLVAEIKPS